MRPAPASAAIAAPDLTACPPRAVTFPGAFDVEGLRDAALHFGDRYRDDVLIMAVRLAAA